MQLHQQYNTTNEAGQAVILWTFYDAERNEYFSTETPDTGTEQDALQIINNALLLREAQANAE